MTKEKYRLILDNCLYDKEVYKSLKNIANAVSLEEAGLSLSADDEEILKIGQKEKRLIWTSDAGTGFDKDIIRQPKYRDTGVIITVDKYNEDQQFESLYKLWEKIPAKNLRQKRTRVNLRSAKLTSSDEEIEIKFT
ncbi:hypothetical protein GF354_05445 [Candidatus Peregrinibacteria bacterium]|nr:hypothetical protein [Candidatus Peregrinibacteria bacterium]